MDILILENGNGGDAQLKGNDLAMCFGIENMPYLALFGGNKGYPTTINKPEQSFDYWANSIDVFSDPNIQFNSLTENGFDTIPLTSSGRVQLENVMKKDLAFFDKLNVKYKVTVTIVATDRIDTIIEIFDGNDRPVLIINFRKTSDGDFVFADFNDDFKV